MLDRAAALIVAAKRPLVMLGAAASRPRSSEDVAQFVLRTRIPYFTTQMGKGTVPGGTELYMGTAALSSGDYVHDAIAQADLIVTIGHDTSEKPPFLMDDDKPLVIHVGYQPATVEQVYFPQAEVVGDMGRSLRLLADRLWASSRTPARCCRCARASSRTSPSARPRTAGRRSASSTTCAR
jgi:acetolactate synthase-1/2/3 large subunit